MHLSCQVGLSSILATVSDLDATEWAMLHAGLLVEVGIDESLDGTRRCTAPVSALLGNQNSPRTVQAPLQNIEEPSSSALLLLPVGGSVNFEVGNGFVKRSWSMANTLCDV